MYIRSVLVIALATVLSGCQARHANEPIIAAVALNDAAQVRQYLAEGGDPDFKSRDGDPLIYVASGPRGGVAVAQLLLKAGADIEATSSDGRPPLHNAASWCDVEMVALLLNAGADAVRSGKNGQGALDAVCKSPEDKREMTLALIRAAQSTGE